MINKEKNMENLEICSYLKPDRVLYLDSADKKQLINTMLKYVCEDSSVIDPVELSNAVWARENSFSTGIGEGIAIPHARTKAVVDFVVAFAFIKSGLDFDAIDKKPVDIVFLIVANENQVKKYIKLLSRLMLRMKNSKLVQNLRQCKTPQEIYQQLVETK